MTYPLLSLGAMVVVAHAESHIADSGLGVLLIAATAVAVWLTASWIWRSRR